MVANRIIYVAVAVALSAFGCSPSSNLDENQPGNKEQQPKEYTELLSPTSVSLESLLDEMANYDADLCFPSPAWTAKMVSSTDARSTSPDMPYWYANTDCTRYIRMENGEKVIFEENGPGVITRIWTVGKCDVPMNLYFDGETTPSVVFQGGDTSTGEWDMESPLVFQHPRHENNYGANLYYPIPFKKSLKITASSTSIYIWAFHFSVRKYDSSVNIESFSLHEADKLKSKAAAVAEKLSNPPAPAGIAFDKASRLKYKEAAELALPAGDAAIRGLKLRVGKFEASKREEVLHNLSLELYFDGVKCAVVPVSDFFGGGSASVPNDSWYFTSDGKGTFDTRFVMPYRDSAMVRMVNNGADVEPMVEIHAIVDTSFVWHTNTMHFHAGYRSEDGLTLSNEYLSNNVKEWTAADITGKGIVKGDVLSVRCHTGTWYGEGDEKIFVDGEQFPSYFGTGTEDYYNSSYAPVVEFENAFGGCLLSESNVLPFRNIWLRTRNLDGMIFNSSLRFNWELESWEPGTADYSSVLWWYALD